MPKSLLVRKAVGMPQLNLSILFIIIASLYGFVNKVLLEGEHTLVVVRIATGIW